MPIFERKVPFSDKQVVCLFDGFTTHLLSALGGPVQDILHSIPEDWQSGQELLELLQGSSIPYNDVLDFDSALLVARSVFNRWATDPVLSPFLERFIGHFPVEETAEIPEVRVEIALFSILLSGAQYFSVREGNTTIQYNRKLDYADIDMLDCVQVKAGAIHFVEPAARKTLNGGGSSNKSVKHTSTDGKGGSRGLEMTGGGDSLSPGGATRGDGGSSPQRTLEVIRTDADDVICSVYAPKTMLFGEDEMIQVWFHLLGQSDEVAAEAKVMDTFSDYMGRKYLSAPLAHGDTVHCVLSCKHLEIDDATQKIAWQGRPDSIAYLVSIPEDLDKTSLIFTVEVFHDTIPVGKIRFRVMLRAQRASTRTTQDVQAKQFEEAFISYSSKDRDEVLRRVQGIKATGKFRIFQDVICLDPGDRWEKELYKHIDTCDVFFLFWSNNAKASKWVRKEVNLAIQRKNRDDDNPPMIQPVPLEKPVVKPWEELGHLHFNDQILYFIMAD